MSKRVSRGLACAVIASALTVVLVGCDPSPSATNVDGQRALEEQPADVGNDVTSQIDALDAYVEAERATIPTLLATYPGTYSDVSIYPLGNDGIDYSYLYAAQVDPSTAAEGLDSIAPQLDQACETSIFPAMRQYGVTLPPRAKFTYYNADGSEIWSHTCTSS